MRLLRSSAKNLISRWSQVTLPADAALGGRSSVLQAVEPHVRILTKSTITVERGREFAATCALRARDHAVMGASAAHREELATFLKECDLLRSRDQIETKFRELLSEAEMEDAGRGWRRVLP